MPRFEKTGRTKESLLELLLAGRFIYSADGSREVGAPDWTFKEQGKKCFSFADPAAAKAEFEKKCAAAIDKKYAQVSERTEFARRMKVEYALMRDPSVGAKHRELLKAGAVGEVEVSGNKLRVGTREKDHFRPDLALEAGVAELMLAAEDD